MVHVTNMKKIILMEQVADEYEKPGKEGRFSKKCIPRGYIPDFDWTTIHNDPNQSIKPIKQEDPIEGTATPTTPTEVEGPPSSCLRPKTKQESTPNKQEQSEHNPTSVDLPECNPTKTEVNKVQIAPKDCSLIKWTHTLLWAKRGSKYKAPVTALLMVVLVALYIITMFLTV